MNFLKLTILFIFILASYKVFLKIDYSKIFKKGSTREINIFCFLMALALGYLAYSSLTAIATLSTQMNFFK